jgi:hypothetical protein
MALTGEKVNKPVHKKCEPSGDRVGVCSKAGQARVGIPETVRRQLHAIHEREIEANPKRKRGRQTIALFTLRVSMGCLISDRAKYSNIITFETRVGSAILAVVSWTGGDREFDIGPAIYPVVFVVAHQ